MPGRLLACVTLHLLGQAGQRQCPQEPLSPGTQDSPVQEQDWFRQKIRLRIQELSTSEEKEASKKVPLF